MTRIGARKAILATTLVVALLLERRYTLAHELLKKTTKTTTTEDRRLHRAATKEIAAHPAKFYQFYREDQTKRTKSDGVWSTWSPWSPCSRSCGGGVTQQVRQCIPSIRSPGRPAAYYDANNNWRRQNLATKSTRGHCVGIYKRFHLCNSHRCPDERDFRQDQCSYFDRFPFKGNFYRWEPFLQAGDECALNCRPAGLKFYATLNKTVVDGTSCRHPLTSTGRTAPAGTRGICVGGKCKLVRTALRTPIPRAAPVWRGFFARKDDRSTDDAASVGAAPGAAGAGASASASVPGTRHFRNKPANFHLHILEAQLTTGPKLNMCEDMWKSSGVGALWCTFVVLVVFSVTSVSSDGIVGSYDELPDNCAACAKNLCKSISGIYIKPDLPQGYSLVAQIPEGACKIGIEQLHHTANHIALKNTNGSFILNGEWRFSPSTVINGAGTRFVYHKSDISSPETISAAGPLENPVDILIVYQQPNSGIKYGYMLPMLPAPPPSTSIEGQIAPPYLKRPIEPRKLDFSPPLNNINTQRDEARQPTLGLHKRRLRRRFQWKVTGLSACSKTCGGGVQNTLFACMREHTQTPVSEKRCSHLDRPTHAPIRCNPEPCTSLTYWKGSWSTCSGSCDEGVQRYLFKCHQDDFSGRVIILDDSACHERTKPVISTRSCKLPACPSENDIQPAASSTIDKKSLTEVSEWQVGSWSQCSVSCGTGHRSRSVTCPFSGNCAPDRRPPHAEYCDSGTCATGNTTSSWLVSEWSQCSESCGTGQQYRMTFCWRPDCKNDDKPEFTRSCSSDRYCTGQWFTGPWSLCPDSCTDISKQHRDVVCMVKVRGQLRITNEMTCPTQDKPVTEQTCLSECPSRWFVGDWGVCEGNCPTGIQHREVRCLDSKGSYSSLCLANERPVAKRTCRCDIREEQANIPAHDQPQDQNCVDKFTNCNLAVKARLCHYDYYRNNCCLSCRKI